MQSYHLFVLHTSMCFFREATVVPGSLGMVKIGGESEGRLGPKMCVHRFVTVEDKTNHTESRNVCAMKFCVLPSLLCNQQVANYFSELK